MKTDRKIVSDSERALDGGERMVTIRSERFRVSCRLTAESDDTFGCSRSVACKYHPGDGTVISRVSTPFVLHSTSFLTVTLDTGRKG